jgi:hypothetical protein
VRIAAVKKHRLFDQTLAYNLSEKVYVFLGAARTNRDVVHARDWVIHCLASKEIELCGISAFAAYHA